MDKIIVHEDSFVDIRSEDGQSVCGIRVGELHEILDQVVEIVYKPKPDYLKEFKKWMKERKLWKRFKRNAVDYSWKYEGGNTRYPHWFIMEVFSWVDSSEGFEFWRMVHNAWLQHLEGLGYES